MMKIVVLLTEGLDNGHTLQGSVVSPHVYRFIPNLDPNFLVILDPGRKLQS